MKKLKYIASLLVYAVSFMAFAQESHTSYFMEGMVKRHELNPALSSNCNYVSIPVIPVFSGLAIGANSNLGTDKFLFKRNDEIVTGLNSAVSADEFLGGLKDNNTLELNLKYDIISFGFKKWGGFNTFGLSLKSSTGIELPYELFEFAKRGQVDGGVTSYDLSDMKVHTTNYVELALGHSRDINEKWRVGAKVKYLGGLARADINLETMKVTMSADKWSIRETGKAFYTDALDVRYKSNGEIDDVDFGEIGVAGSGIGFDLGATFKPIDNLTVSASLTDLGFMSWKGTEAFVNPDEFIFDGFQHLAAEKDPDGDSALKREGDQLEEDLRKLARFEQTEDGGKTESLATTLRVGAEYAILNNKISFGLLSSNRFGSSIKWSEVMASANFRPARWFNATINGSVSNLGSSIGAIINFCPKGFNFYFGTDYVPLSYSKQGVPLDAIKFNFVIGMAITFKHD